MEALNETILRQFFDLSQDILMMSNAKGEFLLVNPAATTVLGWSQEEILGKTFKDFVHPDDMHIAAANLLKVAKDGAFKNSQLRVSCKNGGYKWVEWSAAFSDGKVFAVGRDITAAKNNEKSVETRNSELERVNRLMVGREVKMLELKSEIKRLRHELEQKILENKDKKASSN